MSLSVRCVLTSILLLPVLALPGRASATALYGETFHVFPLDGRLIVPGDFNQDGRVDFVSGFGSNILVALGNGDGSFQPAIETPVDFSIPLYTDFHITPFDVNGDGRLDLVTDGVGDTHVNVMLGNGDGTFGPPTPFQTSITTHFVLVVDLDGDGLSDLACGSISNNIVVRLLGHGDGTFGPELEFIEIPEHLTGMAAADLNHDGHADLITSHSSSVSVLLGNGDGTFRQRSDFPVELGYGPLSLGDVDGDGSTDVVTGGGQYGISVLLGRGDGSLGSAVSIGSTLGNVALGDLDGDGALDLVTSEVTTRLGNGDGTFGSTLSYPSQCPYYGGVLTPFVVLADVDGDGRLDAVESGLRVLRGNGDGTLGTSGFRFAGGAWAIADFNDDVRPDVLSLVYNQLTGLELQILPGQGDGTLGSAILAATLYAPYGVGVGDLNGDGRPDLVAPSQQSGTGVFTLLGNGNGTFYSGPPTEGPFSLQFAIADMNLDGHADVVTSGSLGSEPNAIAIYRGRGDGSFNPPSVLFDDHLGRLIVADVNFDGRPDVMGATGFLPGLGDGTLGAFQTIVLNAPGTFIDAVSDLDGDGRADLVTAGDGTISLLFGQSDGNFGDAVSIAYPLGPFGTGVDDWEFSDLDSDGHLDIVIVNSYASTTTLLLNRGSHLFEVEGPLGILGCASSVQVADFNGDGRPDLVESGTGSLILLNQGSAPVAVELDIKPSVLDVNSMGRWVTATLRPPAPYDPSQIDVASIRLNGSLSVSSQQPPESGPQGLTVRFSRPELISTLVTGEHVAVTVTGTIGGQRFEGVDFIEVHGRKIHPPQDGDVLAAGATIDLGWDPGHDSPAQRVTLLSSWDDGATWNVEATRLPDTGRYAWRVPDVVTRAGRLALILADQNDESGEESEVAVSGRFAVGVTAGVEERFAFALRTPNPTRGSLRSSFSLASNAPALLEVFDVAGRRLSARRVEAQGPGWHTVALGQVPTGVYRVRLTQAGRTLSSAAIVLR